MEDNVTPAPAPGGEQRTLASIMFTDVVGFSKHSAINEERTYKALNRDFDLIYREVATFNGQVLNTMGDGMMVVFLSAIDCIRCAIAIQHALYEMSLQQPEHGKNTMGDSVNQAARIQALARPDSIAMSREFQKTVENKTPFNAKYLGPRMTKNIPEPIPIFEIAPIADEIRQKTADAIFQAPPSDEIGGATGKRGALILIASILLILLAATPVFLVQALRKAADEQARQNGRTFGAGSASKSDLRKGLDKLKGNNNNEPSANNAATPPEANNAAPAPVALTPEQLTEVAAKTNAHDYAAVAEILRKAPGADAPDSQAMIKKFEDLTLFQTWLNGELSGVGETAPLAATVEGVAAKVYVTNDGVVVDTGNQPAAKHLWDYKSDVILSIAQAAAAAPRTKAASPAEVAAWFVTFKEVHRLAP